MKYNLKVTSDADRRREEHVNFLLRVNKLAAARLDKKLRQEIYNLRVNPQNCRHYESEVPNLYYKFVPKRYKIIFGIENNTVYVFDIQDCRQDEDKKLI